MYGQDVSCLCPLVVAGGRRRFAKIEPPPGLAWSARPWESTYTARRHGLVRGFALLEKTVLMLLLKRNVVRWGQLSERIREEGML
jgi:hypothetical protein